MNDFEKIPESTKDLIKTHGLYSIMSICPLEYHGFKKTKENMNILLNEIDFEISINDDINKIDRLLEHRFSIKNKFDA